jgi:hypothetical protein
MEVISVKLVKSVSILSALVLAACSSGGGGGSASGASQASGPLSVPRATCNGSACLGSASLMSVHPMTSMLTSTSSENVLSVGTEVYSYFNNTIIPNINATLYKMEQAAAGEGLTTCAAIAGVPDAMGSYLGDGYYVDISSGDKTMPTEMGGTTMTKKFVFAKDLPSSKFAEAQIACSGSERTFYVRIAASSNLAYEFWAQEDGAKRIIFGAVDDNTSGHNSKITFYFNTADGNAFQLHGIATNVEFSGAWVNLVVAGGANLSLGIADIENIGSGAITGSEGVTYQDNTYSGADPRHCYSNISTGAIDTSTPATTCSGLLSTVATTNAVRTSGTWNLSGMGTAISTSF